MNEKRYEISLHGIINTIGLYRELEGSGLTPLGMSENLDALHDVLTEIGQPAVIVFKDTEEVPEDLAYYMDALKGMCEDAMEENSNLKIEFS